MTLTFVFSLFIGLVTGLRSLTGLAAISVAGWLNWLEFGHTWLAWLAHPATAIILVVLAVGELIADKLPKTPSRTGLPGLGSRLVIGGFCGSALATAAGFTLAPLAAAVIVGVIGAAVGCFGGHRVRVELASRWRAGDLPVALAEDALAIAGGLVVVCLAARCETDPLNYNTFRFAQPNEKGRRSP